MIAIFSSRIGFFGKSIDDCKSKGGDESKNQNCPTDKQYIKTPLKNSNEYCCIPILDKT